MLVQYHFVKFAIKILYTRYILKIHENKRKEKTYAFLSYAFSKFRTIRRNVRIFTTREIRRKVDSKGEIEIRIFREI